MEQQPHKILVVTGEASGDHHGALVIRALRQLDPSVEVTGIGGDELAGEGMRLLHHSRDLAVLGLSEVLWRAGTVLAAYRTLKKEIKKKPSLLMLIDYPEFNLRIAALAGKHNVPVFYYISPQLWAWRQGRAKKIARLVSRMAVIFPFEVQFYEKFGLDARFVGHPLLDQEIRLVGRDAALKEFGLAERRPIIGLLPGSRQNEIKRLFEPMLAAARRIREQFPAAQFIVPLAQGISREEMQGRADRAGLPVRIVTGSFYQALDVCDLVLVASGTATLQTALMQKPMIILYRVSLLTYIVGRLLIRIPWIGLANIVAGRPVVPELIQHEVTPERIAREACGMLSDPERLQRMQAELGTIKASLGKPGASLRVAQMMYEMINP
jgi:lipid-A-disaccharide synthase